MKIYEHRWRIHVPRLRGGAPPCLRSKIFSDIRPPIFALVPTLGPRVPSVPLGVLGLLFSTHLFSSFLFASLLACMCVHDMYAQACRGAYIHSSTPFHPPLPTEGELGNHNPLTSTTLPPQEGRASPFHHHRTPSPPGGGAQSLEGWGGGRGPRALEHKCICWQMDRFGYYMGTSETMLFTVRKRT